MAPFTKRVRSVDLLMELTLSVVTTVFWGGVPR